MGESLKEQLHARRKAATLSPLVGIGGATVRLRIIDEPHALTCELGRANWWGALALIVVASTVMIYVLATEWKQVPLFVKLGIYLLDGILWLALYSHLFQTNRIIFSRVSSSLQIRRRIGNQLVREISFREIGAVAVEQAYYDDDGTKIDNFAVDLTLRVGEKIRLTQSSNRGEADLFATKISQLIGR